MEYSFRKAEVYDLEEVYLVKQECTFDMDSKGIDQWDSIYPSKNTLKDDILGGNAYVMLLHNIIIGFVTINSKQDSEYSQVEWQYNLSSIGVIHRFMIRPNVQGCGYAKALLKFTEKMAKENKFEVIRLDAYTHNLKALRLYEKNGYKHVGKVKFRKGIFNCYEKLI